MMKIVRDNIVYYVNVEAGVVVAKFLDVSKEESKSKRRIKNLLGPALLYQLEQKTRVGQDDAASYLWFNLTMAEGKAICSPDDEFILDEGMRRAKKRLAAKAYKYRQRYIGQMVVELEDLLDEIDDFPCTPPYHLRPKSRRNTKLDQ